jgi:replicative DNA helicase
VEELGIDPREIPSGDLREVYGWIAEHKPEDQVAVMCDSGLNERLLNDLVDRYFTPAGTVDTYVKRLRDANRRQRLALALSNASRELERGDDVEETLARVASVDAGEQDDDVITHSKAVKQALDWLEEIQTGNAPGYVTTGLDSLDAYAPRPGELVVIAAGTTIGKSELALTIASNCARQGIPSLFFSLEMTTRQCNERIFARAARVDSTRFRRKGSMSEADWNNLVRHVAEQHKIPLHWSTRNRLEHVVSLARRLHRRAGIRVVFLDYLQLLRLPQGERRDLALGDAMQMLLHLAQQTDMVVYVGSQLNRSRTTRNDQRPKLSDLRDSGAIEQSAHAVWLLDRTLPDGEDLRIVIAKNRNGQPGEVTLKFRRGHVWEV